jgi:hypothetical protein
MSDVTNIKQKLSELAQQANGTAQALASFKTKFSEAINRTAGTAGGSAQGVDKDTIELFQAAEKKVDEAIQALRVAARAVQSYGGGI